MELHERATAHRADEPELPEPPRCGLSELAPPEAQDRLVEAFKRDVDWTLLVENLKLTPAQRAERLIQLKRAAGRPKDLEPIAELQLLLEKRREREQGSPGA